MKPARQDSSPRKSIRYWPVLLILAVGFAVTVEAAHLEQLREQERLQHSFEQDANNAAASVQISLSNSIGALYAIRDLFAATPEVSRAMFRAFAQGQLERHPGIQALEWVPRVSAAERTAYEARARREGFKQFRFTERDAQGRLVTAGERAEYFPVYYVEPYAGNERALGYAPVEHARHAAIVRSRDTGEAVATERFRLIQEHGEQYGFAVFLPIYRPPATTREARRTQLIGFAEGAFRTGDMLTTSLRGMDLSGVRFSLLDESAPPAERLLFAQPDAPQAVPAAMHWRSSFQVGDRTWSLEFVPSAAVLGQYARWPWGVLVGGWLFTAMLGAYVSALLNRNAQIARAVEQRTAELSRTTAELARSEGTLRAIIEHTRDMIFIKDLEDRYLMANQAAQGLSGFAWEHVQGKRDDELFAPEAAAHYQAVDRQVLATGVPQTVEETVRTADGSERILLTDKFPFVGADGQMLGVVGISRDITDYRRAIEAIARRDADLAQAQELDRLRSNFVNAISHDLRTPLTSIMGYAEFLEDEIGGPLTPEQLGFVTQIALSTRRLEHLVDDLLDFSRLDAGTFRLRLQEADLSGLVRSVTASMRPQLEVAGLTLDEQLPEAPLMARMDPQRTERVLINLIANAIKFTPEGGRITVRAKPQGERVCVEIADTGVGIAAEDIPKLFHRFTQLQAGVRKGGTGLGLSISKAIIEAQGGTIDVESKQGQGSTFWFTLPHAEA